MAQSLRVPSQRRFCRMSFLICRESHGVLGRDLEHDVLTTRISRILRYCLGLYSYVRPRRISAWQRHYSLALFDGR